MMKLSETFLFPGVIQLSQPLERMVNRVHSPCYMVELTDRKPFYYCSTSPAEVISCRLNDGQIISLFCKYGGSHAQYSYGHRGGVEYEAEIYREILQQVPLSSPRFYGYCDNDNKKNWLAIEYLTGSNLLKDTPYSENFDKAAAWIGNLHKLFESNMSPAVKIYDTAYYTIWLNGVENLLDILKEKYPWLPAVCEYFKENLHLLTASPQTFIHGEYYAKNILLKAGSIYPIDWESAAIGPAEIDFASLVEGWDEKRINLARKSYFTARWPDGNFSASEFEKKVLLAGIYFFFRWTGEYDDPAIWLNRTRWFNRFYELAKQAGCG
jgi:thiamine kinase-like enzyme